MRNACNGEAKSDNQKGYKIVAMTRSELIQCIAERFPQLVLKDCEMGVAEILTAIHDALVAGERVEIRGFGSFSLNYRPPRTGRNPKTGDKVLVPGKKVPHFKAGKELRDRVDATLLPNSLLKKAA